MPYNRCYKYLLANSGVFKKPKSSAFSEKKRKRNKVKLFLNGLENNNIQICHAKNYNNVQNLIKNEFETSNELPIEYETRSQPIVAPQLLSTSSETQFSIEPIYSGILTIFYAGKLSQIALTYIIDFISIIIQKKLPRSFDDISNKLLNMENESIKDSYIKK